MVGGAAMGAARANGALLDEASGAVDGAAGSALDQAQVHWLEMLLALVQFPLGSSWLWWA